MMTGSRSVISIWCRDGHFDHRAMRIAIQLGFFHPYAQPNALPENARPHQTGQLLIVAQLRFATERQFTAASSLGLRNAPAVQIQFRLLIPFLVWFSASTILPAQRRLFFLISAT